MPTEAEFMRKAIAEARKAAAPFGAVVVGANEKLIASGHNRGEENPIYHGEIDAMLNAPARTKWSDCTIYTTAEPCPMCQAAMVWAGVKRVVYGTSTPSLKRFGWTQMSLRAADFVSVAAGKEFAPGCEITGGLLEAECDKLFAKGPPW